MRCKGDFFVVNIDIDTSLGSISFDWDRRRKVVDAINSVRPVNTVFNALAGKATRDIVIRINMNTRIRTNFLIV